MNLLIKIESFCIRARANRFMDDYFEAIMMVAVVAIILLGAIIIATTAGLTHLQTFGW